jgi:hypothetical protein
MPPFFDSVLQWALVTGRHFLVMLWWVWALALLLTALSEAFFFEPARRRLMERPNQGWRTILRAVALGVLSPPSRGRIFKQARELLAGGLSPEGVVAYLISAQALLIWMIFAIVSLNGPQPVLGQFVAVAAVVAVLVHGLRRIPEQLWASARETATRAIDNDAWGPIARSGPVWSRLIMSLLGQAYSLWWPIVFGLLGVGFFLSVGQSDAYISLLGTRGPLVQFGNGGVGLILAYVTGAPMIGNAFVAAGLWKPEFVTFAGLSAFYLGTMVMPFVLPRYFSLFGVRLAQRVLVWLAVGILAGALVATAWWWGLDWLAGVTGLRDMFEALTHSTLRPSPVPWFHHWFQVSRMQGM